MIRLSPHGFSQLKTLIKTYAGINLDLIQEKGLIGKIERHLNQRGFSNFEQYHELLTSAAGEPERDDLISLVTVNETFFFRHPDQFRHMRSTVLPRSLAERKGPPPHRFRIWSAGCSTGEEPCSIAYVAGLFEREHPQAQVTVIASDINARSLESARQGIFRQRSVRSQTTAFLEEQAAPFLVPHPRGWQIDPDTLSRIQWKRLNLRDIDGLLQLTTFDIIFCRNVLIYFDEPLRLQLLALFHRLLDPSGVLYLGEAETLPLRQTWFQPVRQDRIYVYSKYQVPPATTSPGGSPR